MKLLPCPFCGSQAKLHSPEKLKDRRGHWPSVVYCETCQCQGPPVSCQEQVSPGSFALRTKSRLEQDSEVAVKWDQRAQGSESAK